jgi:GNAT superfamily N-acetyltransferase
VTRAIRFVDDPTLNAADVVALYRDSGIARPVDDIDRIARMLKHANLTVAAYDDDGVLVGVARALTDFSYCCYLSDLAVAKSHQQKGIGRALVERVHARIGDECMLLLLSAKDAMAYYPKIGFAPVTNGFIIRRRR